MRIPSSTYRFQFCPNFTFSDAEKIIDYLAQLGISDVYASPIFKARSGSTHGYDIVDANQLNPELGTDKDYEKLIETVQEHSMGWVQDIVPNHRAYDSENYILMDVLEHGQSSEYYQFFDIDWEHPYEQLRGKVLTPMLGDFYGNCLENGEIQLSYDETGLKVNYYALSLPIAVHSYVQFLTYNLGELTRELGKSHPDIIKIFGILYLIKNIPSETSNQQRRNQVEFVKGLLWELYEQNSKFQEFIKKNLEVFNGKAGTLESFDLLDSILCEQFYRLSFWKVGAEELNYRRFFTVNELICLRVENDYVFRRSHELLKQLVEDKKITGLRIDHIDGLYDPKEYLLRLKEMLGDTYIVVEKILEKDENLSSAWKIEGTSGYDFLNLANNLFCQKSNRQYFSHIYNKLTGMNEDYHALTLDKKRLIAETNLVGDIDNLAHLLKRLADRYRYGRDFTLTGLRKAIFEVLVHFPVYCTYIDSDAVSSSDRFYIQEALMDAKKDNPRLLKELQLIEKFLLLDYDESLSDEEKEQWLFFVMRFQQFSGPLMAKGVEDTLFYVYNRLVSLNEVGGYPDSFGITVSQFHDASQERFFNYPHSMNTSSTHDTKRSEDIRARLNILSEIPEEWEQQVQIWRELNQDKTTIIEDKPIPDPNDEYFFYQNLLGVFPFEETSDSQILQRMQDYIIKAVREAKIHTAWLRPDTIYEDAFSSFIQQVLTQNEDNEFLSKFKVFHEKVAFYGITNSLAQTLLKITSPGIPDFYQGTEIWDFSLVDPDNRRPVNYQQRQEILKEIKERSQEDLLTLIKELKDNAKDGKIKLFLIAQALEVRNQNIKLFQEGDYIPLTVRGKYADHVVAFARVYLNQCSITVIPRFITSLVSPPHYALTEEVWQDTHIEVPNQLQSEWLNYLTGEKLSNQETLSIGSVLQSFPVALLINSDKE